MKKETRKNKMETNIWAVIGVVLTVLTMFGGVTMFFSNFNAKVVGLEAKVEEMEGNVSEMVAGLNSRDEKINGLVVSVSEMKVADEQVSRQIRHIDAYMAQTDTKYNGFMEKLSEMNSNMVGLGENMKYIKGKFELQNSIILGAVLKKNENDG